MVIHLPDHQHPTEDFRLSDGLPHVFHRLPVIQRHDCGARPQQAVAVMHTPTGDKPASHPVPVVAVRPRYAPAEAFQARAYFLAVDSGDAPALITPVGRMGSANPGRIAFRGKPQVRDVGAAITVYRIGSLDRKVAIVQIAHEAFDDEIKLTVGNLFLLRQACTYC